jgi:hypothetical protein
VVIVSELFEFTLFIGGLRLDSRGNWVFQRVDNTSMVVLRREHHVILIQWHLRSHRIGDIQVREMRWINRLLLMRHKTDEIFRIMT